MKIRQNGRQCSFWYFLAIVSIGLVVLKLIVINSTSNQNKWFDGDNCDSEAELNEQYGAQQVVPVPLSQIMSGQPFVLPQDDKRIIDYIWANKHIHPPSKDPYNLKEPDEDPSKGQAQYIRRVLQNMTNGFFVECGALDGETRSNTLFMEKDLGWKGLLVEGDPSNFALLKKKNRKAWIANTCLSVKPYPHTANFLQSFNTGKVMGTDEVTELGNSKYVSVQCMPLFSLLTALNVTTVDYFSLDVEGSELKVLTTIPFDKIYIRTLSVEYLHTSEGKDDTVQYMASQGYRVVGEVHFRNNWANDLIFVHKDVAFEEKDDVSR